MKSVNFPQGFKEALDLRGIKMGPPKMAYNTLLGNELVEVKNKLRKMTEDLLLKYFPHTCLLYTSGCAQVPGKDLKA